MYYLWCSKLEDISFVTDTLIRAFYAAVRVQEAIFLSCNLFAKRSRVTAVHLMVINYHASSIL